MDLTLRVKNFISSSSASQRKNAQSFQVNGYSFFFSSELVTKYFESSVDQRLELKSSIIISINEFYSQAIIISINDFYSQACYSDVKLPYPALFMKATLDASKKFYTIIKATMGYFLHSECLQVPLINNTFFSMRVQIRSLHDVLLKKIWKMWDSQEELFYYIAWIPEEVLQDIVDLFLL
jgi:hypothetical protein